MNFKIMLLKILMLLDFLISGSIVSLCYSRGEKFASMLSSVPPLQDDEEDVSYDVESLFPNISIQEAINYIIDQIYVHKKLPPICSKLIFRKLLLKLVTECTFKFSGRFLK